MGLPDHRPERLVITARRCLVGLGALAMTYAVIGALTDTDVKFGDLLFLVIVLVAHDGVLMPLVIGAGILIGRFVPRHRRGPVRAELIAGLAVTVVAVPLVLGRGRAADNPSLLPRSYGLGLLEIYGVVGVTTVVTVLVRSWRRRRRSVPRVDQLE
jgi:Na+/proline symporter